MQETTKTPSPISKNNLEIPVANQGIATGHQDMNVLEKMKTGKPLISIFRSHVRHRPATVLSVVSRQISSFSALKNKVFWKTHKITMFKWVVRNIKS